MGAAGRDLAGLEKEFDVQATPGPATAAEVTETG
jgi:hypothetical protein